MLGEIYAIMVVNLVELLNIYKLIKVMINDLQLHTKHNKRKPNKNEIIYHSVDR